MSAESAETNSSRQSTNCGKRSHSLISVDESVSNVSSTKKFIKEGSLTSAYTKERSRSSDVSPVGNKNFNDSVGTEKQNLVQCISPDGYQTETSNTNCRAIMEVGK